MITLTSSLEVCLRRISAKVHELVREGKGAEVIGAVPGRSTAEDLDIGIDRACELIIEDWLREMGLPVEHYSEHGTRTIGETSTGPRYLVASDPFDGSGLFMRGLPAEWWSVLTVYSAENSEPICGGAIDVLRNEVYLADGEGVTLLSIDSGARTRIRPAPKTVLDDSTVLAAYFINPAYLSDWARKAENLLDSLVHRFPAARIWPNGGACIYPWLARGLVHAYVMFEEPRSEIDPGLAFAWASGYPVFSVEQDGHMDPYCFVPGKQTDRVPFFIAACTTELGQDVVRKILGRSASNGE